MKSMLVLLLLALGPLLLAGCQPIVAPDGPPAESPATSPPPVMLEPDGFVQRIHDPVMAKEGDTYYVFSTASRIIIICSQDMVTWEFCGRVFERVPTWIMQAVPGAGDLWAPDISYFNGKWHLYYAASTFGSPRSAIGLATNTTLDPASPDYAWVDEGMVIESTGAENWNAIDPNLVLDDAGEPWLAFGSYWSGLKLIKLDAATGKRTDANQTIYAIAQRPADGPGGTAIEAPFIVKHGEFYYLFASFDACCRGRDSTYNVRVGRAVLRKRQLLDLMFAPGDGRVTRGSLIAESSSASGGAPMQSDLGFDHVVFGCQEHGELPNNTEMQNNILSVVVNDSLAERPER